MPELPEVETIRRGLEPVLAGARIERVDARRADLRFPFPPSFAERLAGRTILTLGRRAKYMLARLDDGMVLALHLGMTGRFSVQHAGGRTDDPGSFYYDTGRLTAHDHVVFHLEGGTRVIYNDVRRFGFMTLVSEDELEAHPLFRDIGIEPTGNDFNADTLARLFRGKAAPLKAALLDQRLIAGLGNIYVCEALFRAGLSPTRAAGSIVGRTGRPLAGAQRLAEAVTAVLAEAIEAGGSTLRDYAQADGSSGAFQERFRVYGREGEPCVHPGCRGVVRRTVQSGRSTFHCVVCQR